MESFYMHIYNNANKFLEFWLAFDNSLFAMSFVPQRTEARTYNDDFYIAHSTQAHGIKFITASKILTSKNIVKSDTAMMTFIHVAVERPTSSSVIFYVLR
jgi:predicted nucleotidyltransferase component of viral defense system